MNSHVFHFLISGAFNWGWGGELALVSPLTEWVPRPGGERPACQLQPDQQVSSHKAASGGSAYFKWEQGETGSKTELVEVGDQMSSEEGKLSGNTNIGAWLVHCGQGWVWHLLAWFWKLLGPSPG